MSIIVVTHASAALLTSCHIYTQECYCIKAYAIILIVSLIYLENRPGAKLLYLKIFFVATLVTDSVTRFVVEHQSTAAPSSLLHERSAFLGRGTFGKA